jgi:endonuclease YncB( thermonuclease family)
VNDPYEEFEDAHPASVAWSRLQALGVEATSGFRTDEDTKRLKRQGYTPAANGAHPKGDGIDLIPGKSGLSLRQLQAKARAEFGDGARVSIDNGTHVHVAVPGWGAAPDLYRDDPWDAFKDAGPARPRKDQPKSKASPAPTSLRLSGTVHDGDTVGLTNGGNARLLGLDAFELGQQGWERDGSPVPLGSRGRDVMAGRVTPDLTVNPTGKSTYGRPVVTLGQPGEDPAQQLLREGYGLAAPEYLKGSDRLGPYMEAERLARMNLLGAHGMTYQLPEAYRRNPWKQLSPARP